MKRCDATVHRSRRLPTALWAASLLCCAGLLAPADRLTPEQGAALPGVLRATADGDMTVLETEDSGPVLAAVDAQGGLHGVQTRTPSLEDVYLSLTGEASPAPDPAPAES